MIRFERIDTEAAFLQLDLGAARAFGVPFGAFQLGDEAPQDVPRDLDLVSTKQSLKADNFFTLRWAVWLKCQVCAIKMLGLDGLAATGRGQQAWIDVTASSHPFCIPRHIQHARRLRT
ncbi:hypothetical protein [Ideonella dechloratans]|uniref:hypothetical protein n=1 Tax=Ideonella dechloratans TaxID=36863 RepID=UPI0035B3E1D8